VDLINGPGGKDTLSGGNNNDTVQGGDGRDSLSGDAGNDLLQGEEGADLFLFALDPATAGNATLADFDPEADLLALSAAVFTAVGPTVGAAEFVTGSAALDGNDHLIHDPVTGLLMWDADVSGSTAAAVLAQTGVGLALSPQDFRVT
jgi:Ca2+-binding RTX toxin-like protein